MSVIYSVEGGKSSTSNRSGPQPPKAGIHTTCLTIRPSVNFAGLPHPLIEHFKRH